MNAIPTIAKLTETTADAANPGETNRLAIFSPRRQAAFIDSLMQYGNVRLAARAATISPQTAYRARRASPQFAAMWDAALLSARTHAEEVLADRAINGVEEAVFYHGEEVARRRRYDTRLLLAHLARLDRLEAREGVAAMLGQLDEAVDALREGKDLQDCVPAVPKVNNAPSSSEAVGQTETPSTRCCGKDETAWQCDDCPLMPPLERRLRAMEAARPADAPPYAALGPYGAVEARQLAAFEAGREEWWLLGVAGASDAGEAASARTVPHAILADEVDRE